MTGTGISAAAAIPGHSAMGARCGQPLAADGREIVGVRQLLEWAFASECAQLDYDEVGEASGGVRPALDSCERVRQQLELGARQGEGVRVDRSFGRSLPHNDAEMVATVLRNSVRWSLAIEVASYARARRVPRWDLGPQRVVPVEWSKRNQLGVMGKATVCQTVSYWCRGRLRKRDELWVPVKLEPSTASVAAARRDYLEWWGALLDVWSVLRRLDLELFVVADAMPPMEPWKKRA